MTPVSPATATRVSERLAARHAALPPPPPAKRALSDADAASLLLELVEQGSPKRPHLIVSSPVHSVKETRAAATGNRHSLAQRTHSAAANALASLTSSASLKDKSITQGAVQARPKPLATSTGLPVKLFLHSVDYAPAANPLGISPHLMGPVEALNAYRLAKSQGTLVTSPSATGFIPNTPPKS